MAKQRPTQSYIVGIYDDPENVGALRFTFVPKSSREARSEGEQRERVLEYIASVQGHGEKTEFKWLKHPAHDAARDELEAIACQRVTTRHEWLERLRKLVATVKEWADELDWATRVVDKKMEDAEIGNYKAPSRMALPVVGLEVTTRGRRAIWRGPVCEAPSINRVAWAAA